MEITCLKWDCFLKTGSKLFCLYFVRISGLDYQKNEQSHFKQDVWSVVTPHQYIINYSYLSKHSSY